MMVKMNGRNDQNDYDYDKDGRSDDENLAISLLGAIIKLPFPDDHGETQRREEVT
jgi:hypothetical protein